MAVNSLAKQVTTPVARATEHQKPARLPSSRPPAPRPGANREGPVAPPVAAPRDSRLVIRHEVVGSPAERSWLGAPRLFRLPNVGLPRVALPSVGAPHWSFRVPTLPVAELTELGAGAAQLVTLWNGPNIEDIRRFEGDAGRLHSYGWFQNALTECADARSDAARHSFLAEFSAHGAPKLTDELAALEYFCMKTAYLRLRPGDRYRFCCADFGWQKVAATIRDFETGLVAHVLIPDADAAAAAGPGASIDDPDAPAGLHAKPPVLLVFRGTARASTQPEAELAERPTGCQADLDWDGIGFHAFAANEVALLGIVRRYMAQGHRVILAGHSLGGVFAARTMCALSAEEQRNVYLRTFNASGLDPATRRRAAVPENNIMVRHRDDKLPRAGGELLDGTLVTTIPQNEVETLYPHGMPLLAANALNEHPALFTKKPTEPSDMSRSLEMGRKFLCLVAHDRVEI